MKSELHEVPQVKIEVPEDRRLLPPLGNRDLIWVVSTGCIAVGLALIVTILILQAKTHS